MAVEIRKGNKGMDDMRKKTDATNITANHVKAITDYNIMMGVLEDPAEDEDDE